MGSSRSTEKTELPEWYATAAKEAISRANQIYELGRTPYTGVDVVAVNPYEQAASRNVGSMASAFGLDAPAELSMGGMPTVTSGGVTGYSSYPMYVADMERLKEQRPDQYEYFARMTGFDPITGAGTGPLPAVGLGAADGGVGPTAPIAPASVGGKDDGPSHLDIMKAHNDAIARREARRVTLSDGTTGTTPFRPLLRPDSRVGLSGVEQNIREGISTTINNSPIGKLFGALTNRA